MNLPTSVEERVKRPNTRAEHALTAIVLLVENAMV